MLERIRIDPRRVVLGAFPILRWSRSYDLGTGIGDLIAGITVALTLIPQSIAYASLAGFEPQYGLYASFAGSFVYAIMGTCPQINIGPTALLSLLTFTYTAGTNPDFAILLCLIGGIVQFAAGITQLGFLVNFISLPVVSGFTSAAAITIASSQIKGLLGIKFKSEKFVSTWRGVFEHIGETRLPDTLLSLSCCIVLLGMKALKDIHVKDPADEKSKKTTEIIKKSLWFAGVARNAVVVALAAILAYFICEDKSDPLLLTGDITPGLPVPRLPPFQSTIANKTIGATEMLAHLGSGLVVVPLVGIISNVAIAKAFSNGRTLDATQEIIALGACNIVGAFFLSYPVNGSFSRSAVSDASGVRTPAAGFYTGIIVLLTLGLLTPYFYYIPRSALAAVIVCAVLHMVDIGIIKKLWSSSRIDLVPLISTFVFCLAFGIEVGLVCGVIVDTLLILYYNSKPPLDLHITSDGILPPHYSIRPVCGLHFAAAEKLRSELTSLRNPNNDVLMTPPITPESLTIIAENCGNDRAPVANGNNVIGNGNLERNGNMVPCGDENRTVEISHNTRQLPRILVVQCDGLYRIDYTVLQGIKSIVAEWRGPVIWYEVRTELKRQLDATLQKPTYCDTRAELLVALTVADRGSTQLDDQVGVVIGDTHL